MASLFSRMFSAGSSGFADELASDLSKRLPPALMNDESRRPSAKRIGRVLEGSLSRAVSYKQEKKLGVLGKARLANEFRWKLKELGYDDEFVDLATEAMTIYISRKPVASP
jgi:hypothetical protein